MPDVPPALRTNEPDDPPAPPSPRVPGTYVRCEFCGCKVTRTGEVFEMSDIARGFRDAKESHRSEVTRLEQEITNLNQKLSAKEAELSALRGSRSSGRTVSDALL